MLQTIFESEQMFREIKHELRYVERELPLLPVEQEPQRAAMTNKLRLIMTDMIKFAPNRKLL